MQSLQSILISYPQGLPTISNFGSRMITVPTELQDSEVLVKLEYVSVDPYLRIRLNPNSTGYFPPFELNEPLVSRAVAKVIKSNRTDLQEGDHVSGFFKWQHVQVAKDVQKIDTSADDVPLEKYLSVLGGTGLTAYFGLLEITHPKAGEVVLVSGAAGATGSVVCQIAKIKGCTVIAIAGSDEKCKYLKDTLHVDKTINYKTCGDIKDAINQAAPDGIDIYFDNVGGETQDAAICSLKQFGRVSLCGQISNYNSDKVEMGPRVLMHLVNKNAKIEGFLVGRWQDRFPEAIDQLHKWYKAGLIKSDETISTGPVSEIPRAFIELLSGANLGKMIHKVSD